MVACWHTWLSRHVTRVPLDHCPAPLQHAMFFAQCLPKHCVLIFANLLGRQNAARHSHAASLSRGRATQAPSSPGAALNMAGVLELGFNVDTNIDRVKVLGVAQIGLAMLHSDPGAAIAIFAVLGACLAHRELMSLYVVRSDSNGPFVLFARSCLALKSCVLQRAVLDTPRPTHRHSRCPAS